MRISGNSSSGHHISIEIRYLIYGFIYNEEYNSHSFGLCMLDSQNDKWYVTNISKEVGHHIIDTITKRGWYILDDDMILELSPT